MQYCIYLRKSRADNEAEARGESDTFARHQSTLMELAKRRGLQISAVYKELVSGETIAARPVMQQLLSEVEEGLWAGVLVMEVERLARGDTIDQGIIAQTFKYSNTKIITPLKTYDPSNEFDEEYFEFGLFMSRREYKTINRRLQRGRAASAGEGKFIGNKSPYGYIRKKLEKQKGFTLEIVPEQAYIVRLIFELYAYGEGGQPMGASKICRRLNAMGIKPMNSDVWTPATIAGILQNPVYIGKIRFNSRPTIKKAVNGQIKKERPRIKPSEWTVSDGLHQPIIDLETWSLVQNLKNKNRPVPLPEKYTLKNPLSGLVRCGICGRAMIRRPYGNHYPDVLLCATPECPNISSQLLYVEKCIITALAQWLDKYRPDWQRWKEDSGRMQPLKAKKDAFMRLSKDIETLTSQMSNAYDLLEQGVYSTDVFSQRFELISERLRTAQDRIAALSDEIRSDELRQKAREDLIPGIKNILEVYSLTENPALKNELLKSVLEKAVYTKTAGGRQKPDGFEIVLFPKLPK